MGGGVEMSQKPAVGARSADGCSASNKPSLGRLEGKGRWEWTAGAKSLELRVKVWVHREETGPEWPMSTWKEPTADAPWQEPHGSNPVASSRMPSRRSGGSLAGTT